MTEGMRSQLLSPAKRQRAVEQTRVVAVHERPNHAGRSLRQAPANCPWHPARLRVPGRLCVMGAASLQNITSPADISAPIRDQLTNNVAEVDLGCLFVYDSDCSYPHN